jgi:hypothetical protein
MSLILTPMQVKLKQEKFSKSVNQIASMKSRFGSLKHTNKSIIDDEINQTKKTGLNRLMTRYSKESKENDNLTQKTDLSDSAGSFSKMFQGLKISLESNENLSSGISKKNEKKKSCIYSQKFKSGSNENQNCFLDLEISEDNQFLCTPFMNEKEKTYKQENTKDQLQYWKLNKKYSKSGDKNSKNRHMWASAESTEINEIQGGFDLMKIIDNPMLYSSSQNNPFENSTYQTSNLLVNQTI